ncbi:MAG TPA: protein translocase subunit SecF, partial [Acidimicrobiales bacterium]|nr:protein translocase subunit SecF [Acidimicrobiales bacterium]
MSTTTVQSPAPAPVKRPNAFIRLYRGETSFDFVGRRRYWYMISGTIILAGLVSLGVRGLNLGIDFKGGTEWTVPAPTLSVTAATNAVKSIGITPSVVESLGTGSSRAIEVEADLSHLSASTQATDKTDIANALAKAAHSTVAKESIDDVGATWGGTVTGKAIEAMVVFFILVTIYIAIRFQWRMALAALMKVILHDLLITVGIFSLTWFQVTPNGVIAVLTIMGYSLYDTVVVFDKINENTKGIGATRRFSYPQLVNLSLNQVLSRSLNTSLVAVLPVLSVLLIGAQVPGADTLRQFGFPLVIGLIAGAYSSIFIAAPLP